MKKPMDGLGTRLESCVFFWHFRRFWVKKRRHPENISDENCCLFRSTCHDDDGSDCDGDDDDEHVDGDDDGDEHGDDDDVR